LKLIRDKENDYKTVSIGEEGEDVLQKVFENGELKTQYTFEEVIQNSKL
jgi:hypothetical protein